MLVVANKVEDKGIVLILGLPEATTELLHEHDRRLRAAQHDDLVQRGDVHALVEDVNRKQVLKIARLETGDGLVPLGVAALARDGQRAIPHLVELARELGRLVVPTAEDEAATVALVDRILLDLLRHVANALVRRETCKQPGIVIALLVNLEVGDAKVMKRGKHVVRKRVLQGDLEGNNVVEQRKHVKAIGPARSGRHAQIELGREEVDDLLVARRAHAVGLVNHDVVKLVWAEVFQVRRHARAHGEQTRWLVLGLAWLVDPIGVLVAKKPLVALERGLENAAAVHEEQHASGIDPRHVKGRQVSLSRTCGRDEQRTGLVMPV